MRGNKIYKDIDYDSARFNSLCTQKRFVIPNVTSLPDPSNGFMVNFKKQLFISNGSCWILQRPDPLMFTSSTILSILPTNNLYITMIGGGGAGGSYSSTSGIFMGGGGGGGGEACTNFPICLSDGLSGDWRATLTVGRGGTSSRPDGEDTVIVLTHPKHDTISLTVAGGKGAALNTGGEGGSGNFHSSMGGEKGQDGEVVGAGFSSTADGGKGGNSYLSNAQACGFGRGGTGMSYGSSSESIDGQNGVIIIKY